MFNTVGSGPSSRQALEENAKKLHEKLLELECFYPVQKDYYWNYYFTVKTNLSRTDPRFFLRLYPDGNLESYKVYPGNPEIEKTPMEEFLENVPEKAVDEILFHLNLLTPNSEE